MAEAPITIKLRIRTDGEGRAVVELPPLEPNHLYEATVALVLQGFMHPSFPPGYEKLFGCIDDETFVAPPRSPYVPPDVDVD